MGANLSTGAVAGISVTSTLIAVAGIAYLQGLSTPAYPAGPSTVNPLKKLGLFNWFQILYYFLPYALFLFGIVYDGLGRTIKFFPAGFIGLANVYLSSLISWALYGYTPTDRDICGIPGMSSTLGSDIAPQNILFTTTVLSYIASYISASQSDSAYSGAAWGSVGIAFLIQLGMFWYNDCYNLTGSGTITPGAVKWTIKFLGPITPPLVALAGGMLVGGLSGWGVYVSGIIPDQPKQIILGPGGTAQNPYLSSGPAMGNTSGVGKCSPTSGGDDDAFVCEAYKNGELVTSTIVE